MMKRVVKFNEGSGSGTPLSLSNFGNLGLPYWLTSSIEKMYSVDSQSEVDLDHSECFHLLPGRVDIELIVYIPEYADLIEQPHQGCIWCQARGAASEITGVERQTAPSQKVSATQKFYDDLDSLIFTTPGEGSTTEAESQPSGEELQEGRVRIGCTINTSPGTSEAAIYAALYLRLKKNLNSQGDSQAIKAAKIADILEPKRKSRRDMLIKLLMMSERELEDVVFMRPLNVRLNFNCDLHPKGEHSKGNSCN
ncbi:uncharacterized protein LOC121777251 [Salvia splendens]|uniref:uncharacterized protein LOC121777251 n=1 Tax=Salvia splendens TaxID=180675 RepID=UPI001C275E46|nr:uncharacterized protein LOC121777251 [Salvia splendens]